MSGELTKAMPPASAAAAIDVRATAFSTPYRTYRERVSRRSTSSSSFAGRQTATASTAAMADSRSAASATRSCAVPRPDCSTRSTRAEATPM